MEEERGSIEGGRGWEAVDWERAAGGLARACTPLRFRPVGWVGADDSDRVLCGDPIRGRRVCVL